MTHAGSVDSNKQLSIRTQVFQSLDAMRGTLSGALPSDINVDKFTSVVKTALNNNPDLLGADRQTLYNECVRAAQDGLLPDGREGALVIFNTNAGTKASPKWIKAVKWMPMIGGYRKKAAKHDFDLIAQVVYKNDHFEFRMGDDPKIVHTPTPLGEEAGPIIGFYAIATNLKDGRKYREVMTKAEVDAVRAVSKSAESGPWASWYPEQGRKTVARRLFKQLPLYTEDDIQTVIQHENEEFNIPDAIDGESSVVSEAAAPSGTLKDKIVNQTHDATAGADPGKGEANDVI